MKDRISGKLKFSNTLGKRLNLMKGRILRFFSTKFLAPTSIDNVVVADQDMMGEQRILADIGALTASIQHDIRNPLAVINTEIHIMRSRFMHIPGIMDGLKKIEDQARRIYTSTEIVSVLRGQKYYQLYTQRTSVGDVLRRSVKDVQKESKASNVYFKDATGGKVLHTGAYRPMLEQAVVNILKNSVEAIHEAKRRKGIITLGMKSDPTSDPPLIRVDITDNGCGIPQEDISKITGLFTTKKNKKPNSGVGLFITGKIVAMFRGRLEITSKVGEGTTVSLFLPRWKDVMDHNNQEDAAL